ncbi:hypothetical protein NSU_4500 [Novosphingobium pentaromativorans US6-1]|uniref:Uncharacterized protein n=1 Tax=Novosphingobium pentaromativorans US6-1 TaxID=1088721 RepID=G6EJH9_9SPHN|nr:hypothetical protein NSU_4500 [Novosphingobium pentaromativorans US6-1]
MMAMIPVKIAIDQHGRFCCFECSKNLFTASPSDAIAVGAQG